jgi:hypothetical protein
MIKWNKQDVYSKYKTLVFYREEAAIFEKYYYMNRCKKITQFSTEVIKSCPYIKKTISSRDSNSTAYRVQYSHKEVFQGIHILVF